MKIFDKEKWFMRWGFCLAVSALVIVFGVGAEGVTVLGSKSEGKRPDLINIDAMKVFGDLERPPVIFLHDRHTEAMAAKGKDCSICHLVQEFGEGQERLSIKYMRLEDNNKKEVMGIYHNNCIQCHTDIASEGEKSGPLVCGECHREKPDIVSSGQPMGMDKSLHFRHVKAHEKKCEQCHHEYDEKTEKLIYAKGKEGTCRYCHKDQTEENRISMREASHISCVDCHLKTKAKEMASGPVDCGGCHDLEARGKIELVEDIPRMERGQPDIVFVKRQKENTHVDPEIIKQSQENLMNPVPFSHLAHEQSNDTCRVCHHAGMEPCFTCHTLGGDEKGNFVRLETAMHQLDSEKSCRGCHENKKDDKNCSGCHEFIHSGIKSTDQSLCISCHMNPVFDGMEVSEVFVDRGAEMVPGEPGHRSDPLAQIYLESRVPVTGTYSEQDIPETVIIKKLAKQYEPTELPHRKIVNALMKNIQESKITQYFHNDPGTLCQGCHHNSPVSKKPPSCESCHSRAFEVVYPYRPGLMAAYHNQCMGCHDRMGIEKPATNDCTGCHKERKK